ncbi:right-handed parallel beta-helix repeat-containing protein [Akkermansiaceae bacterium]|nr:right-handed parallel beta-helix repeat-containing protein [Akkermansiaceae bacterium]
MSIASSIIWVVCAALGVGGGSAASHYVALDGNDANSGLESSPWRTLAKACDAVPADEGHTIHIGEGTFIESGILTLKSGVSLIGAGSDKTTIRVNHHFNLTDAIPNANPHVHTFPEHFVLQMNGSNQVVKGFSLDGQEKRCHGGIFAASARGVVFDDLHVRNFRYSGLWIIEAHDTTLRFSRFKNNTYGNPKAAGEGGGDSGAVQYHRGKNLSIHDNHIEETGNLRPDFGGYALKAQDRKYSVSESNVLEGLRIHHNTLIVPTTGAWENGKAPAISAEFLGMALKDCEIHHNTINNHISLAGTASLGTGIRIHHNFFNLGPGRYAYAVEAMMDNVEIDRNHFFGGLYPIAVWQKHPRNHNIHHNIFEAACGGKFTGRELLQYKAPVTDLRFTNNTIIDSGGIGRIFALHESSSYEARNNLILRTLEPEDIWGTEIPGKVSHNFFSNVTPRGEKAMTGDPRITLSEAAPLRPPHYTFAADSPLLDKGETIAPLTDGFTGAAPDIGAIENGIPLNIPGGK